MLLGSGEGCTAVPEPSCVPCVTRSLCQRGAAAKPCFVALTLAGGSMCHLHHLQGYQSTSPRCSYGNCMISCFLSPPWVSVSGRDSPHREPRRGSSSRRCWSRCGVWAQDFHGIVQHIKSNRACSPEGPPSGTLSLSSPGCCCSEGTRRRGWELGEVFLLKVNLKPRRSWVV